jgi:hypothetical protein
VAATSNPVIPIFVFREQNIDFPVPYLNYYFDQPLSNTKHLFSRDVSSTLLNAMFHNLKENIVRRLLRINPQHIESKIP